MYETNAAIKKFLILKGFHSLYLFPHLRFFKDYNFEGQGFDAFGWKINDTRIYFFQFKTNEKPTKKLLEAYKQIGSKYNCVCCWATKIKRKGVFLYGT